MIIINKKNQVLVGKRAKAGWYAFGKWCIPGGKTEEGENFENAVVREIKEEVGCDIAWMRYFKSFSMQIDKYLAHSIYFYGEVLGKVKLKTDELSEYRWISLDDPELLKLDYSFDQKKVMTEFVKFWKEKGRNGETS